VKSANANLYPFAYFAAATRLHIDCSMLKSTFFATASRRLNTANGNRYSEILKYLYTNNVILRPEHSPLALVEKPRVFLYPTTSSCALSIRRWP